MTRELTPTRTSDAPHELVLGRQRSLHRDADFDQTVRAGAEQVWGSSPDTLNELLAG